MIIKYLFQSNKIQINLFNEIKEKLTAQKSRKAYQELITLLKNNARIVLHQEIITYLKNRALQ